MRRSSSGPTVEEAEARLGGEEGGLLASDGEPLTRPAVQELKKGPPVRATLSQGTGERGLRPRDAPSPAAPYLPFPFLTSISNASSRTGRRCRPAGPSSGIAFFTYAISSFTDMPFSRSARNTRAARNGHRGFVQPPSWASRLLHASSRVVFSYRRGLQAS